MTCVEWSGSKNTWTLYSPAGTLPGLKRPPPPTSHTRSTPTTLTVAMSGSAGAGAGAGLGCTGAETGAGPGLIGALVATYMVAKKVLENWIYWFVLDSVSIFVYVARELYVYALLFVLYLVLIVVGYRRWRADWRAAAQLADAEIRHA